MSARKIVASLLLLVGAGLAQDLKVAAAADLSTVMPELSAAFEKATGTRVDVSLGSSGNFFAQLENGAPFDVFLSADKSYPEKLQQAGLTEPGTLVIYARGKLVLWTRNGSPLAFTADKNNNLTGDLGALAGPSVPKVAIANPEHAPYGRAAVAVLQHFGIYDKVKPKLILGENIAQAAQFGESGNADAAFIACATALTQPMRQKGRFVLLPQDSYPPLDQAAVVLKSSQRKTQAHRFIEFLRTAGAQAILRQAGFEVPAQ